MGDPRIHAALSRGAVASPPLRRESYTAARLDQQLDDQCRRWLDDRSKNRPLLRSVGLSEVLQWFADDFKVEPYGGVSGFARRFARPHGTLRDFFVGMKGEVKITYLPFDWRLNQAPADDEAAPSDSADKSSADPLASEGPRPDNSRHE